MALSVRFLGKEIFGFEKSHETRSLENPKVSLTDADSINAFIGEAYKSFSGANVTPNTALSISALYRGIALLSGQIASLPLGVYRRDNDGNRFVADEHPAHNLLHTAPNHLYTSFIFRETMMVHLLLLDGNFYAYIERGKDYRPSKLWMLDPKQVRPILTDGQMFYFVTGFAEPIPARDMIHVPGLGFDGIKGLTPLKVAAQSIGYGITLQEFSQRFFSNGANVGHVIEHPNVMKKDQFDMFRESWDRAYEGVQKSHKTAILQGGAKLTKVGVAPEEAQFIESRKLSITDIARIIGVPPHKIYDLERSTFSNIEHQALEFVQDSIIPWIVRIEQEFNRKLFTNAEMSFYYCKHNVNGLLRGDVKTRSEYYQKMIQTGVMKPDEARALEDMNKEGGLASELFYPMNFKTESQYKAESNGNNQ